jgi:hypothetical protein
MFGRVLERFLAGSPVTVAFRAVLERALGTEWLDQLFERTAQRQRTGELLFSTCVELLAQVVGGMRKSVNAAYQQRQEALEVSIRSVYNKLARIEPCVSEALVRESAAVLAGLIPRLKQPKTELLPGYRVRIADVNHLAGTDHRLKKLRRHGAAALPGQALAVLDPALQLVTHVLLCEDGHANERLLIPRLLELVQADDCWISDRNFCTVAALAGIAARQACFVIRQHQQLQGRLLGMRKRIGRCPTGMVFEQALEVDTADGPLRLRRITVELDQPTRDGDTEVHIFTNLPAAVGAVAIAELYLKRWKIETAFMHLATVLRSELNTLGYPDAALFGFCLGLVLYNVLMTLEAALRGAHPEETKTRKISLYYLGEEISGTYRGMVIAVPPLEWKTLRTFNAAEFAACLRTIAERVPIKRFLTNPQSTKQAKPPPKIKATRGGHVSTFQVLKKRSTR